MVGKEVQLLLKAPGYVCVRFIAKRMLLRSLTLFPVTGCCGLRFCKADRGLTVYSQSPVRSHCQATCRLTPSGSSGYVLYTSREESISRLPLRSVITLLHTQPKIQLAHIIFRLEENNRWLLIRSRESRNREVDEWMSAAFTRLRR